MKSYVLTLLLAFHSHLQWSEHCFFGGRASVHNNEGKLGCTNPILPPSPRLIKMALLLYSLGQTHITLSVGGRIQLSDQPPPAPMVTCHGPMLLNLPHSQAKVRCVRVCLCNGGGVLHFPPQGNGSLTLRLAKTSPREDVSCTAHFWSHSQPCKGNPSPCTAWTG